MQPTDLRFKDKVVQITGGTSGIGLGLAERFLQEGASVVVCSIDKNIDEVVNKLRKLCIQGASCHGMHCDVTNQQDRLNVLKFIEQTYGKLDVLVANAGLITISGRQLKATEQQYDKVFEVNVKAVFFQIKESIPLLKKGGKNSNILVTSSEGAKQPGAFLGIYCMTKAAVDNMVPWLA